MAYKKKCPECGEWSYSASSKIWKCTTCGAKIDEEKAVPAAGKVAERG